MVVETSNLDGLFLLECSIDGKQTSSRYQLDPGSRTSRGGHRDLTFKHWEKSRDGQVTRHAFAFAGIASAADDDEGGGRPAVAGWTHGKVEVRIFEGVLATLPYDAYGSDHSADLSRASVGDEKSMVKNGLSVAASAGSTSFRRQTGWRAGETYVRKREDESGPDVALEVFYRDSFFMALREDTCCHGACAREATAAELQAKSDALGAAGAAGGATRAKAVHERETREAVERKRPNTKGSAKEAPIDLCSDGDE